MPPMRVTAILLIVLSLGACANGNVPRPEGGPPWADADKNGVTLSKGADECKYQAKLGAKSSTGVSNLPDVEADLFDNCMRRMGFLIGGLLIGQPVALIKASAAGWLSWPGVDGSIRVRAALGKGGVTAAKAEGDGATPIGIFPLRALWYRPDRIDRPVTGLTLFPIDPECGWSDDPADPAYNRPVKLPHAPRHERLWRQDGLYDLIVPLGYNDDPPVAGLGSAIFLHCAAPDYTPTEGCVAIARLDLLRLLQVCGPKTRLSIEPIRQ